MIINPLLEVLAPYAVYIAFVVGMMAGAALTVVAFGVVRAIRGE